MPRRTLRGAAALLPIPSWGTLEEAGELKKGYQKRHREAALAAVREFNNDPSRTLDVLQLGDSLTAPFLRKQEGAGIWARHMDGLDALPLGVGGSSVEQLAWRLFYGGEMPARAPRSVVFFIGEQRSFAGLHAVGMRAASAWQSVPARLPPPTINHRLLLPSACSFRRCQQSHFRPAHPHRTPRVAAAVLPGQVAGHALCRGVPDTT